MGCARNDGVSRTESRRVRRRGGMLTIVVRLANPARPRGSHKGVPLRTRGPLCPSDISPMNGGNRLSTTFDVNGYDVHAVELLVPNG